MDGTVGGSYHSLFLMVKHMNKYQYNPVVLFYEENVMIPDFRKVCDVSIFTHPALYSIEKDLPKQYERARKSIVLRRLLLLYQKAQNAFRYHVPNLWNIYKYLKKNKIDLIHLNNFPDLTDWLFISKLLKIKIISHLRGFYYINAYTKSLIKYYDKVISTSRWVSDQIIDQNITMGNVVLIHNGIDIHSVNIDERTCEKILKEWNTDGTAPVIGVIGNIRKWKGQHVAIEAMNDLVKQFEDIRCVLVGEVSKSEDDIEYLRYLQELISKYDLGKNIIFTGFRKDIYEIIHNLDILIHTSILPEPFGRVLLEGMVLRKPVIATNQGGPLEIVEDGISGFLLPPENPEMLAGKITYLLENKDIARAMGENARKRVEENFSIERNVRKVQEVYAELLGNG
jgi:glycosyltransferase involved in cell wall biosynthesis